MGALVIFSTGFAIQQARHADVVQTLVRAIAGRRTRLAVVQEAIAVHTVSFDSQPTWSSQAVGPEIAIEARAI